MVVTEKPSETKVNYLHADNLGSVDAVTDASGAFLGRNSFNAWGESRKQNWEKGTPDIASNVTTRGFTGHEMLDDLALIHMNGRVYDPVTSRFMSADIMLQAPSNTQSYNRYSYVFNNPLSFTDPSGYCGLPDMWIGNSGPEMAESTRLSQMMDFFDVPTYSSWATGPINKGKSESVTVNTAGMTRSEIRAAFKQKFITANLKSGAIIGTDADGTLTATHGDGISDAYRVANIGLNAEAGHSRIYGSWDDVFIPVDSWRVEAGKIENIIGVCAARCQEISARLSVSHGILRQVFDTPATAYRALEIAEFGTYFIGATGIFKGIMIRAMGKTVITGRTNAELVQEIANRAEAWGVQRGLVHGPRAGTLKHGYADELLTRYQNIYGSRGLQTETSWLGNAPAKYGTSGSTRLDVWEPATGTVFDYKFGNAVLSPAQVNKITTQGPLGVQQVISVHP